MVRGSRAGGQEGALEWEAGEGDQKASEDQESPEEALMNLQLSGMEPRRRLFKARRLAPMAGGCGSRVLWELQAKPG